MAPPEPASQDPAERVPLQTVSAAGGEREDGAAPAKAHGSPSTGRRQTAAGLSSWFSKPRVKWVVIAVVALILLLVIVLAAALLSTGRGTDETDATSVLTFWPKPEPGQDLIWFRTGSSPGADRGWLNFTTQLKELVAGYDSVRDQRWSDLTVCPGKRPEEGEACFFDIRKVHVSCSEAYDFGYSTGSPCVFIQFGNVTGWDPEPLSPYNVSSQDLPERLKTLFTPGIVLLHCDGDTVVDRENIGDVVYSPYQGFPTEFFPYTGQRGYMPPLVAVQFWRPEIGVIIGVRCRLLVQNPPPGKASTDILFYLLVD